ncbi:MAG: hypothetical protein AAFN79_18655 [Pseudomonadota bacterium]
MSLFAILKRLFTPKDADARRLLSMQDRDLADIGLTSGELGRLLGGGVNRVACCSI